MPENNRKEAAKIWHLATAERGLLGEYHTTSDVE